MWVGQDTMILTHSHQALTARHFHLPKNALVGTWPYLHSQTQLQTNEMLRF